MDFESFIIKEAKHFTKELIKQSLNSKKPRRDFLKSIKKRVLARQNHRCNYCNRVLGVVNFDHIDRDKSNNSAWNCQALCPNCHARKTRKKG